MKYSWKALYRQYERDEENAVFLHSNTEHNDGNFWDETYLVESEQQIRKYYFQGDKLLNVEIRRI